MPTTNKIALEEHFLTPAMEEHWAPTSLHPADPLSSCPAIAGCDARKRAMWEWGVEMGSHALRLLLDGVAGPMVETLSYLLSRFDTMVRTYGMQFKKRPSEYIHEHIFVKTSGMFSAAPLACAMSAPGASRVMFSVDYLYVCADEAANFIENVRLGEQEESAAWAWR